MSEIQNGNLNPNNSNNRRRLKARAVPNMSKKPPVDISKSQNEVKDVEYSEIFSKTTLYADTTDFVQDTNIVENSSSTEYVVHKTSNVKSKKPKQKRKGVKILLKVIRRTLVSVAAILIFAVIGVYGLCYTIANGPSPTVRNMLVLSAKQASATKWVPSLFLPQETIDQILEESKIVHVDEIEIDDYTNPNDESGDDDGDIDEWADAVDGIKLEYITGPTFKAYMLVVKDPSRVFVGVSSENFSTAVRGETILNIAKKYNADAIINAGEFNDAMGTGTGNTPMGLTYSMGKCVWNDGYYRTFMGFDSNNKLVVANSMTKAKADELGIRDAVCFQNGNVLINEEDGKVKLYYSDGDNGASQRTAIGQRADGAVLMLVTDGRSASSLGATRNDVIDIMVEYGAVSAGMLDGGSSSLMYRRDYAEKYGIDPSKFDSYQQQGLVNKYRAFAPPRNIPTFFVVAPRETQ